MVEKQISFLIDEERKIKFDKWCIDNRTNKTEFFIKMIDECIGENENN